MNALSNNLGVWVGDNLVCVKVAGRANFSGSVEDDEIDGKLNGGGIPITVRAGSGRIDMTMK